MGSFEFDVREDPRLSSSVEYVKVDGEIMRGVIACDPSKGDVLALSYDSSGRVELDVFGNPKTMFLTGRKVEIVFAKED